MKCIFCYISAEKYLAENQYFFVIQDIHPITKGHSLIISKRHTTDFFSLQPEEMIALLDISKIMRNLLDEELHPEAYNLLMNCGSAAHQSIFHFHLHFIPRYHKDGLSLRAINAKLRSISF
ncbi:MAG: AP-4-A phosphorylase [Candidatus Cloacimonetes bacterium ADurb.Bin211]|jgi:diadenosine tetraphosphate (Ap4A) HIT family hydrolase|nr:MAG: AP-4-A phosphorylase [Candidatus Cloacimonetes bacterium ADurb.Bin211]